MDNFEGENFEKFIEDLKKENPELENFNFEFLRDMDSDTFHLFMEKLLSFSKNFVNAESKAKEKVESIISNFSIEDIKLNLQNYLDTVITFPFAMSVNEDVIEHFDESGDLKGKFLGKDVRFDYETIFELIAIKRLAALELGDIIRKNITAFVPIREQLKNYLESVVNNYLQYFSLDEIIEIDIVKEFNMLVTVKPKHFESMEEFYDTVNQDHVEKFKLMKIYLITEFSIAMLDTKEIE